MAVPALVTGQTAAGTTGTASTTSLTLTLPSATTKGNCLVVALAGVSNAPPSYPAGPSVNIGGLTDHFAQAASLAGGNSASLYIFACPNCQTSSTSIGISFSSGTGSSGVIAYAYEFSGVAPTSPVDQPSTANSGTTTFTSGATAATTQANEVWVGIGGGERGGVITATGPGGSWNDQTALTAQPSTGTPHYGFVSGYQAGALGTSAVTYSGTLSLAVSQLTASGAVVALLPLPPQLPRLFLRQTAINRGAYY